jgi:hypothetical protein
VTTTKEIVLSVRSTALASALSAVVLATAAPAALAADAPAGSAFALAADGLLAVPAQPSLDGSHGVEQKSVASLRVPQTAPAISADVLNAAVAPGRAEASVTELTVGLGLGLSADVITATCVNGVGEVSLAGVTLGGRELALKPAKNSGLNLEGVASVVLNEQVANPDGSLTVTAVAIRLLNAQTIDIASATCAAGAEAPEDPEPTRPPAVSTPGTTPSQPAGDGPDDGEPGDDGSEDPGAGPIVKAPRPTPVAGHLPVTG